jgi:NADH:ubiquinone oxidoreductase subunit K
MLFKSLAFWTIVAGAIVGVAKLLNPAFPIDAVTLLLDILFVLSIVGIVPTVRRSLVPSDIFKSLAFWQLIVSLVGFTLRFVFPTLPAEVTDVVLLSLVVFVLGFFGVNPELRARGLLK